MMKRTLQLAVVFATFVALDLVCPSLVQAALIADVGGVLIADNGPFDRNPAVGVIDFDNDDGGGGGAPNFASIYQTVQGTVRSVAFGGPFWGGGSITLTDFDVRRGFADPGGVLTILFQDTFANPPRPPALGIDHIHGQWTTNAPTLGPGSWLEWQGFVNGVGILGAFNDTVPGPLPGPASPRAFRDTDVAIFGNGPAWTLLGQLDISISTFPDRLRLPDSATVSIVGVPGPGTLALAVLGLLCGHRQRRH